MKRKLADTERKRKIAMSPDGAASAAMLENDDGAYYIENGRMQDIIKPRNDKMPKVYVDTINTVIKDYNPEEYLVEEEEEAAREESARKIGRLGSALMVKLAQTAVSMKKDQKMLDAENQAKHKPSYKRTTTIELGALKLPENEASKKVVNALKSALAVQSQAETMGGFGLSRRDSTMLEDAGLQLQRSSTYRKKNNSSMKGVECLENMDLEVNLNPKDGVTCFKAAGGFEQLNLSGGLTKYQVHKKGKPYTKMSKDNKTFRMTKDKYVELTENDSLRKMREDYDKMTATMRES